MTNKDFSKVSRQEAHSSKIYMFVLNELFVKTVIIEVILVFCYLTLWFKSDLLIHGEVRSIFKNVVDQTEEASLMIQELNLVDLTNEAFDNLGHYKELLDMAVELGLSSTVIGTDFEYITKLAQGSTSGFGYYLDGTGETPIISLDLEVQKAINTMGGLLSYCSQSFSPMVSSDKLLAISLTERVSLIPSKPVVTIFKYLTQDFSPPSQIFSIASVCYDNIVCPLNCIDSSELFSFDCFTNASGAYSSPLKLTEYSPESGLESMVYSTVLSAGYTVTIFYQSDINKYNTNLEIVGSKTSVFTTLNLVSGVSLQRVHFSAIKKVTTMIVLRSDPIQPDYSLSVSPLLSQSADSKALYKKDSKEKLVSSKRATIWNFTILTLLSQSEEAFIFSKNNMDSELIFQLSLEIALILAVFSFNIYMIHK